MMYSSPRIQLSVFHCPDDPTRPPGPRERRDEYETVLGLQAVEGSFDVLFPSTPVEQSRRTSGDRFARLRFEIRLLSRLSRLRPLPIAGAPRVSGEPARIQAPHNLGACPSVHCHRMSDAVLAARAANQL